MMKSPAIVLRTSKYAEDRLIVETYTELAGPQTFITRISHGRRKGGISHTLFQPLALVEIEWAENQRGTLLKPTAAHALLLPQTLHSDPAKVALVLFLSEFLRAVLRSEPPTPILYKYIETAIRWLDEATDRPVANFHLCFLLHLTRLLGIFPSEEEIHQICLPEYHRWVPQLLRMDLTNQHLYRFTRQQRAEFLRIILLYYKLHQTAFPELKSVDVLTELFD